jgi:hypothetical protein
MKSYDIDLHSPILQTKQESRKNNFVTEMIIFFILTSTRTLVEKLERTKLSDITSDAWDQERKNLLV